MFNRYLVESDDCSDVEKYYIEAKRFFILLA